MSNSKVNKNELKESLKNALIVDYNLSNSEVENIISLIDFDCSYLIEDIDSPKELEFFTTLEYVKDNIYISPSEFKNSYYGVSEDPSISLGQYIKVAIQEKTETLKIFRNPENSLVPGHIDIIEDEKQNLVKPKFDPSKSYVALKKITHKITSVFNSDYCIYVILIYIPNPKKVKKYLKTQNTLKKFKK